MTDFNFTAYVPATLFSTHTVHAILELRDPGKPSGPNVYRSSYHLTDDLGSHNFTVNGDALAGILVGAGMALCPKMRHDDGSTNTSPLLVTGGNYRGYLVDENPGS